MSRVVVARRATLGTALSAVFLSACIMHVSSSSSTVIAVTLPRQSASDGLDASLDGFASNDAASASPGSCEDVKREILARAEALTNARAETFVGPETLLGTCLESPAGRWSVSFVEDPEKLHAEDSLFHLQNDWKVRFEPARPVAAAAHAAELVVPTTLSDYGVRKAGEPRLFDFDGDGVPELFLSTDEEGDEGHSARQIALLTYREGRVEPYLDHLPGPKDAHGRSALAFDSLADVDADGRPDLVTYAGYTHSLESCASGFPTDFAVPRFVYHSLKDGRFSSEDAEAKAYAMRFCPSPKPGITSSEDAICARLWAKDPASVARARKRVIASCQGKYCDYFGTPKSPPKNATLDCERRLTWFDLPPPLTLP